MIHIPLRQSWIETFISYQTGLNLINKLSLNEAKTNYIIFKNKYSPSACRDVKGWQLHSFSP